MKYGHIVVVCCVVGMQSRFGVACDGGREREPLLHTQALGHASGGHKHDVAKKEHETKKQEKTKHLKHELHKSPTTHHEEQSHNQQTGVFGTLEHAVERELERAGSGVVEEIATLEHELEVYQKTPRASFWSRILVSFACGFVAGVVHGSYENASSNEHTNYSAIFMKGLSGGVIAALGGTGIGAHDHINHTDHLERLNGELIKKRQRHKHHHKDYGATD